MHTKTFLLRTCPVLGAALVCMLFSAALAAQDRMVTVAVPVSAKRLDLTRMKDAQTFYTRLQKAAWVACTSGNRIDLLPVDDYKGCYEKTLASAIRSAKVPLITRLYLSTHTFEEALAQGIYSPTQTAGR
jgi:UrcA family protein